MNKKMNVIIERFLLKKVMFEKRTCRYCGYSGSDWGDSDECPNCGEIN